MSDPERTLRDALRPIADRRPPEGEVALVLERHRRQIHRRRALALAATLVAVLSLGALSISPARAEILGAFERLGDFLDGSGDPPGARVALREQTPAMIAFLEDAQPGTSRVLAGAGGERLVAFRQRGTGLACLAFGDAARECAELGLWRQRFAEGGTSTFSPLTTTLSSGSTRRIIVWGIAGPSVAEVRLDYDGLRLAAPVGASGFAIVAPEGRVPIGVRALNQSGEVIADARVDGLQWSYCATRGGCRQAP